MSLAANPGNNAFHAPALIGRQQADPGDENRRVHEPFAKVRPSERKVLLAPGHELRRETVVRFEAPRSCRIRPAGLNMTVRPCHPAGSTAVVTLTPCA